MKFTHVRIIALEHSNTKTIEYKLNKPTQDNAQVVECW